MHFQKALGYIYTRVPLRLVSHVTWYTTLAAAVASCMTRDKRRARLCATVPAVSQAGLAADSLAWHVTSAVNVLFMPGSSWPDGTSKLLWMLRHAALMHEGYLGVLGPPTVFGPHGPANAATPLLQPDPWSPYDTLRCAEAYAVREQTAPMIMEVPAEVAVSMLGVWQAMELTRCVVPDIWNDHKLKWDLPPSDWSEIRPILQEMYTYGIADLRAAIGRHTTLPSAMKATVATCMADIGCSVRLDTCDKPRSLSVFRPKARWARLIRMPHTTRAEREAEAMLSPD